MAPRKRQAEAVSTEPQQQTAPSPKPPCGVNIGKSDIKRSALEAWRKLDAVIQTELTAVQEGKKELNASTVTAITKYVETSISLASGSEDLSPKDAQDKRAVWANLTLPTFDDEHDEFTQ
jgi:hypothetical protein